MIVLKKSGMSLQRDTHIQDYILKRKVKKEEVEAQEDEAEDNLSLK